MKNIKCCIGLALLFLSVSTNAANYSADGEITGMFTGSGNIVGIFHSATWLNPAGCSNGANDKSYLIDYSSTEDWNKVHSMLLSAYVSKSKIRIAAHPTKCFANYPIIDRVSFKKGY